MSGTADIVSKNVYLCHNHRGCFAQTLTEIGDSNKLSYVERTAVKL